MGLDDFKTESKTSTPSKSSNSSTSGVDDFLDAENADEVDVSGGFSIPTQDDDEKETDVVKVFGGPGTGKTTTIVGNTEIPDFSGIMERMFRQRSPDNIMLIAYTRAAADEAKNRLVQLTDVSKSKADERITTIHSMAMRFNNLQPKDIVEIRYSNDKYNFCQKVGLEYKLDNSDDDEAQMLSTPDDDGHLFFKMLSWLKSKLKSPSEYEDCPLAPDWPHGEQKFVKAANKWEEYKNQKGIWEFDDAILECVDNGDTVDTQYLFVDEVQDLYPLQQAFLDNQFGHVERIFLAGDDDQCLPPSSPVLVEAPEQNNANNSGLQAFSSEVIESDIKNATRKPIKDVEIGERVVSATGNGEAQFFTVTDKIKSKVVNKRFRTFTTKEGYELTVTDNHKLFNRLPSEKFNSSGGWQYVYAMRDIENRWRIGQTDNLRKRLNVERTARCIVPLGAYDSKEEALLAEQIYSVKYGIPTITFTQRQGEILSSEENKKKLYSAVPHDIEGLAQEAEVDLSKPPMFKKATTRERTNSININIDKCSDARGGSMGHKLSVHTSNEEAIEELKNIDELNANERNRGGWRFRKYSNDYKLLGNIAQKVQQKVGGDIITQFDLTESRDKALVIPASNVVEGTFIPVLDGEEIVWDEVVQIENEYKDETVYDLTVDQTHNYVASGVAISNTIYEWAGAKPEYFLEMDGKINNEMPKLWEDKAGYWEDEGIYILDQSWRMPNEILELAKMTINKVNERQDKQIKPHHEGGKFVPLRRPNPRDVISLINPDDTMVLFRAKYQMNNFGQELIDCGIPYIDRFKTWKKDVLNLRDGIAALKNDKRLMSGTQASRVIEELPSAAIKRGENKKRLKRKFGNRSEVQTAQVVDVCRYRRPNDDSSLMRWCKEFATDDMHYYRAEAVRNNLRKDKEHLDPEGVELETIHGSKGQEADTIILSTDTTQSVLDNMPPGDMTDAERRLYYVGMTRTKNRLIMCEGLDKDSEQLTLDQIIGKEWREKHEWANQKIAQ